MRYTPKVHPYIIAEIGACHNNDLEVARKLIEIAQESICDAVKFQLYGARSLSDRRKAPELYEAYRQYQLRLDWLQELRDYTHHCHMDFILSIFDHTGLGYASEYADILKISSFEAGDSELCWHASNCRKPLIISTGMSTPENLERLRSFRTLSIAPVALLHCISSYPAPKDELNLAVINTEFLDGYSDHSRDTLAGALAVCYGAKILEVHIRSQYTKQDNPDYPHSLAPDKLGEYIFNARKAARMSGDGVRTIAPSEEKNLRYKFTGQE